MRFNNKNGKDKSFEINLTPLIDIVFLLLIFFMVSTTFIYSDSIKVNLPSAKGEQVQEKKDIRVSLNKKGMIFVNGKVIDDDKLLATLKNKKKEMPDVTVIIEADRGVTHGKVVFVMDASRKAGYEKFAIAVEEQ